MPLKRAGGVVKRREALEELITTPGWQIFVAHCLNEFQGVGYVQRMRAALAKGQIDAQAVDRAALEIVRLLDWPKNQVLELKGSVDDE